MVYLTETGKTDTFENNNYTKRKSSSFRKLICHSNVYNIVTGTNQVISSMAVGWLGGAPSASHPLSIVVTMLSGNEDLILLYHIW